LTIDDIVQHGVARNSSVDLMSAQTRKVDSTQYPASFGLRNRSDPTQAVKVPSTTGHSPMADEIRRRDAAMKRTDGRS
jgi:hypothetical protein